MIPLYQTSDAAAAGPKLRCYAIGRPERLWHFALSGFASKFALDSDSESDAAAGSDSNAAAGSAVAARILRLSFAFCTAAIVRCVCIARAP